MAELLAANQITIAKILDGEQGIPGEPGADGKTSYFHIKYSAVANPTSSSEMSETPKAYIGTYVDFTEADSTDPTKYTWSRFEGIQGEKGEQGIPGIGQDGRTSYLHIAYATSADGSEGFSISESANKTYIGQYTDFVSTDSTDHTKYAWTKIKGETGVDGYSPTVTTGTSSDGSTTVTVTNKDGSTTTALVDGKARVDLDNLSDKTRSGFIETLSGSGFVQSNKTEDGGTTEVVVYGKSVQNGTPTPEVPVEIQSVENPKITACGKNLARLDNSYNTHTSNFSYISLEPNNIEGSSSSSGNDFPVCFRVHLEKGKTYKISADMSGNFLVFYLYKTNTWGEFVATVDNEFVFSGDSGEYTIAPYFNLTDAFYIKNFMLELGSAATPYEPYQGNTTALSDIVLRSTPDGTRDRVFKDSDGLWKIERNVNTAIFDGSEDEDWRLTSAKTSVYEYSSETLKDSVSGKSICGFCNQVAYDQNSKYLNTTVQKAETSFGVQFYDIQNYFGTMDTVSDWRVKLTANPIVIVYKLAAPTYETLPDSIQAELNAMTTYNSVTNVMVSDGITPDIDVSFWTRDYRAKSMAENAQAEIDSIKKRVVIDDDSVDIVDSTGRLLASYGDKTEIYDRSGKAQVSLGATKSTISGFDIVPLDGGHDYFKSDWEASDGNFYRTWIRSADNTDLGQTWAFSTQMKNQNNGILYGGFVAKSNGDTSIMPKDATGADMGVGFYVTKDDGIRIYTNKTVSSQPNIRLDPSNFRACYTTWSASSEQIKDEIKSIENAELNPQNLYDVNVVQFKYKPDVLGWDDERYGKELIGFIIEDLNEKYPIAVDKADEYDPKTWNWNSAYMIPAMLKLIQEQHKEIEELKELMKGNK